MEVADRHIGERVARQFHATTSSLIAEALQQMT
jgi:hypothetical protein